MSNTNEKIASIRLLQSLDERLTRELNETRKLINKELRELARIRFGVEVGSLVYVRGKKHIVTRVKTSFLEGVARDNPSKPWLKGTPMKADGSPSKSERNLYDNWSVEP